MSTDKETEDLLRDATLKFGEEFQWMMFSEEIGELLTAISHHRRGRISSDEVAVEIADVQLMIETIMPLVNVTDDMVKHHRASQLKKIRLKLVSGNQNFGVKNMTDVKTQDTTMTFKQFFQEQEMLLTRMGWPGGKNQEGAHKQLQAAIVEIVEALSETNWKCWKPTYLDPISPEQRDRLKTELTDVMQFVVNTAIYMGYTAEELSDGLWNKLGINHERINKGETTNETHI